MEVWKCDILTKVLHDLATEIRSINRANGWNVIEAHEWTDDRYRIPTILALIHSEVSEALEAFRAKDKDNFAEEMADIIIRVLDCTGGLDIDLAATIIAKLEKNRGRGYRHGGKVV